MKKLFLRILPAAVLCAVLGAGLCGCGNLPSPDTGDADDRDWSIGNTSISDPVENLAVKWVDGTVTVGCHDGDDILVEETCNKPLTEETTLHWRLDGTTLHVEYGTPGPRVSLTSLNKQLTVLLPKSCALGSAAVSVSSGDVFLEDLQADQLALSASSGSVSAACQADSVAISASSGDITVECKAKTVSISTSSGFITLAQKGAAESVSLDTSSGDITAVLDRAARLEADTSSGFIDVTAADLEDASFHSSSGSMTLRSGTCPRKLTVDTSSGDVTVAVPDTPGFTARIDTSSGDFDSGIALSKNGDTYSCGDGSGSFQIDTSSGNVKLLNAA
ncbi:MAG: DUF4097 family beta strand repeat protein [Oscillospiraceae bacterium]|nr:DUF4097 family beta strand repeat protein [Oscillospiraceae bacterium]